MAILNNLKDVRAWMGSASPQNVPQWQVDNFLRRVPQAPRSSKPGPSFSAMTEERTPTEPKKSSTSTPSSSSDSALRRAQVPSASKGSNTSPFFHSDSNPCVQSGPSHCAPLPKAPTLDSNSNLPEVCSTSHGPKQNNSSKLSSACTAAPSLNLPTNHFPLTATGPGPLQSSTQLPNPQYSDNFSDSDSQVENLIDTHKLGISTLKRSISSDFHKPKRPRVQIPHIQTGSTTESAITQEKHTDFKPSVSSPGKVQVASSSRVATQNPDSDVRMLQAYIRACESKIQLLTKLNAVNDSSSLSLDAKKLWREKSLTPKMNSVEQNLASMRPRFSFLDPLPPQEDISNLNSDNSLVALQNQSISIVSPPSHVLSSPVLATQNEHQASPFEHSALDAGASNYNENIAEARRIILERRNNPIPHRRELEKAGDDSEDNFGGDYMDGLESSQPDELDTSLSGFVAPDDEDDGLIDNTYINTQGTQNERNYETDMDNDSSDSLDDSQSLIEEIDDIRLSQDVAARFESTHVKVAETIEVSDAEDSESGDFTTQLNEGRDEVVEIPSEDDLDDIDLDGLKELSYIKSEQSHNKIPIVSESDFSDDDDEILKLSNAVKPRQSLSETQRKVLPGSEEFIEEVYDVLHNVFHLQSFRSNQLQAVVSTLKGKDVFVLIPTGGGKSLCYQLPALVKSGRTMGTTIVISPLISLMQDQIHHLLAKNIRAGMISSRGSAEERNGTFRALTSGQLDLVYLSPEMVNTSGRVQKVITKLYENKMLARIVVDEAHCVSSWGHDFRPDYKGMSIFKQQYPDIPVMALTATANEKVRLDIIHNLKMSDPILLKQSFNRTNLFYEVKSKPASVYEWIKDYVIQKQRGKTGIIYCHSKHSCETTAAKLNEWGISCNFYHAGMDPNERFEVQTKWQQNEIQLICATIAFGMGIDKPDVRFVIHIYIPRSLEGYYQETGRAGRDGLESECIMFYSYKDARALQSLVQRDDKLEESAREMHLAKLRQVVQYCENKTDCRRRQVLHFFNETFDPKDCNKMCDNCCNGITSEKRDVTQHCINIVKLVQSIQMDKVTVIHCHDVYKGSKNSKIMKLGHFENDFHGMGKDLDRGDMERIFFYLQSEGALVEYQVMKGGFASTYVKLGPNANIIMKGKKKIELAFAQTKKTPSSSRGPKLTASGNGSGLANFRHAESFVSARQFRQQEESEKENIFSGVTVSEGTKIVLPKQTHNGKVNDSNSEAMEKAFNELRNFRLLKSQELGFGRPNYFIGDALLKEMAIKLPTNARAFSKLDSVSKDQEPYFVHFKRILGTLSRERKKANLLEGNTSLDQSAYGYSRRASHSRHSQPSSQRRRTGQRSQGGQAKGKTRHKSSNSSRTQNSRTSQAGLNSQSAHIRQMPI